MAKPFHEELIRFLDQCSADGDDVDRLQDLISWAKNTEVPKKHRRAAMRAMLSAFGRVYGGNIVMEEVLEVARSWDILGKEPDQDLGDREADETGKDDDSADSAGAEEK